MDSFRLFLINFICPKLNKKIAVGNIVDMDVVDSHERQMGSETEYKGVVICPCGCECCENNEITVSAWEYPVGSFELITATINNQEVKVKTRIEYDIEDDDI